MRPDGQPFEHWSYRRIGDPGLNAASVTLLNRLLSEGRLSAPRAWLMRRGLPVSVRQALRFDFTAPTPLAGQPGRYHRLWLVEQADRQVFAYGVERPNASLLIGGRLLRGWPALDPQSPWLMTLAEHLADAVLLKTPCSIRPWCVSMPRPTPGFCRCSTSRPPARASSG